MMKRVFSFKLLHNCSLTTQARKPHLLRILFVTSEAYPLVKTGGLADVSGSLPKALSALGQDVRILIPGYPSVIHKLVNLHHVANLEGLPIIANAELLAGNMPDSGVQVLVINSPSLYQREGGPYVAPDGKDWEDNPLRFGILSKVAAILSSSDSPIKNWIPEIVHCNDWQSGLTPAYMHYMRAYRTDIHHAKSVISIHNLAFQGCFSPEWVAHLGLPQSSYSMHGLEYYGQISFLKAGVFYADMLCTVSETYAKEIQTPAFGFGMQGLLASRAHEIKGILNGIDTEEWNPAADPHLSASFDAKKLVGKQAVKQSLQKQLGLEKDPKIPLLGVVSRLTHQKGLDMLLDEAEPVLRLGCQIALLGSGEAQLESGFKLLEKLYPKQVSINIGYNEPLSHQIMAGADIFIMPSRFEPCGLNQMYGLRYGTPSIVTNTGGLADSITNTDEVSLKNNTATGFIMTESTPEALKASLEYALKCYANSPLWHRIQRNGMRKDLSWEKSAQAYMGVYQQLLA